MDPMTRDVTGPDYCHADPQAPPPLHVADSHRADANWWPYVRPHVAPMHPGPLMVTIPHLPPDEYGEDPTDPARCHSPRIPTGGLVGRLDIRAGQHNVRAGGVRA